MPNTRQSPPYDPKLWLGTLIDGVFAVATMLLVIDLRLRESFAPFDAAKLAQTLCGLPPQVSIYAVSFYVLALCWGDA